MRSGGCATRSSLVALLSVAFAAVAPSGNAQWDASTGVRLLVQRSPLAGFQHYAAPDVWNALREGDRLELILEPDNPYDPRAVRVEWRGLMLGYLPRRDNDAVAWALSRGEQLLGRIHRMRAHPNPARRLEIDVLVE